MSAGVVRVGVSGWTHAGWRGVFYPKGLRREHELAYAASRFAAIEVNATFYGLLRPDTFAVWARQLPAHAVLALRGPRELTHVRRLHDVADALAGFFASGPLCLGPHLGPIVWQLPSNLPFDAARLDTFLELLPRTVGAAALLCRRHRPARCELQALAREERQPIRHALDVRHGSFRTAACIDLLRAHGVALVCGDAAGGPGVLDVTADFIYCRLRSPDPDEASAARLDGWAERLTAWARGCSVPVAHRLVRPAPRRRRDVFVFFDSAATAPAGALDLRCRLGDLPPRGGAWAPGQAGDRLSPLRYPEGWNVTGYRP